jgi:hypothetical protein
VRHLPPASTVIFEQRRFSRGQEAVIYASTGCKTASWRAYCAIQDQTEDDLAAEPNRRQQKH